MSKSLKLNSLRVDFKNIFIIIISILIDIIFIDYNMDPKCCKDKKSIAKLLKVVEFLKVISDENRLKILCLLRNGEKCVCEIWQYFELPQNLTSHHLKVLKNFKLVESRKEGLKVFYSINNKTINKYLRLLNKFILPEEE